MSRSAHPLMNLAPLASPPAVSPDEATPVGSATAVPSAAPADHRIAMFDAMRVAAAMGVMAMHTPLGGPWLRVAETIRFGVAFFTIAALILLARSLDRRPNQSLVAYAAARAQRLLVPLLLWSLIYVVFYLAMQRWMGLPFRVTAGWGLLLGGSATHLWFLPFILVACMAAFPVLQAAQRQPDMKRRIIPLLLLAAVVVCLYGPRDYQSADRGLKVFIDNATWALPTFFVGLAVALVYPKSISTRAAWVAAVVGAVLFATAAYCAYRQVHTPAIQAAKGLAVAMIALSPWSPRWIRFLARYGKLSFGVYLVHLLCVVLIRETGRRYFPTTGLAFYPAVVLLAFLTSYAIAIPLNRTRVGKALFP